MGLGLLPQEMITDELAQGTLQRVLPEWQGAPVPIYAITETRLLHAKTRCFINFIQQQLKHRRLLFIHEYFHHLLMTIKEVTCDFIMFSIFISSFVNTTVTELIDLRSWVGE